MTKAEKAIENAQRNQVGIAALYNVPVSAVVWMGGNKYIIVKDGEEIKIEFGGIKR